MIKYFLIIMDDDVTSFSKRCNAVNYADPKYLICKHIDDKGNKEILGFIPHSRIKIIRNIEES